MKQQQPKFKLGDIVYTLKRECNLEKCKHCGMLHEVYSGWEASNTPLYVATISTSNWHNYETEEDVFSVDYELFVDCDEDDAMFDSDLDGVFRLENDVFTKEEVDAGIAQAECNRRNAEKDENMK